MNLNRLNFFYIFICKNVDYIQILIHILIKDAVAWSKYL